MSIQSYKKLIKSFLDNLLESKKLRTTGEEILETAMKKIENLPPLPNILDEYQKSNSRPVNELLLIPIIELLALLDYAIDGSPENKTR